MGLTAMFQPELEALPGADLARLQPQRLRWTLEQACRNEAYRRRLGSAAGNVRSLEEFGELPFVTKADLRDAYPLALCTVGKDRLVRFHMSSGTTGNPILQPYT